MGRSYLAGTFVGHPHYHWRKMYRGSWFTLRCGEPTEKNPGLSLPRERWTKQLSAAAANAWWRAKEAELTPPLRPPAKQRIADQVAGMSVDEAVAIITKADELRNLLMLAGKVGNGKLRLADGWGKIQRGEVADSLYDSDILGNDADQTGIVYNDAERHRAADLTLSRLSPEAPPVAGDLDSHIKNYLALAETGMKPRSYGEVADFLNALPKITDQQGRVMPAQVADIDNGTVERLFHVLANQKAKRGKNEGKPISQGRKKKHWGFFKAFVGHLAEKGVCPLPTMLRSKSLRFKVGKTPIRTFTDAEVIQALDLLPEELRLHALLAANCSMNNVDIANLAHEQIKGGYLTRRREKLLDKHGQERAAGTPTVRYKLWPTTLALLEKFRSSHPRLVLTSTTGTPLLRAHAGKNTRTDLIGRAWQDTPKERRKMSLKDYRTAGATKLGAYDHSVALHYLANSPIGTGDKFYIAPNQEKFDAALHWLGQQFGQVNAK